MTKKRIVSLILVFLFIALAASTVIVPVYAAESNIHIIPSGSLITEGSDRYDLYLEDGVPFTMSYWKDHPTIKLVFSSQNVTIGCGSASLVLWHGLDYSYASANFSDLTSPLYIISPDTSPRTIDFTNVDYVPSETTPPETEPTDPEHGGGGSSFPDEDDTGTEDDSTLLNSITSWIESFFSKLLKPIFDYIEGWLSVGDAFADFFTVIADTFTGLVDDVTSTIESVYDFVDDIGSGVIEWIMKIWQMPIIKELMTYSVFILIVTGLFKLFTS